MKKILITIIGLLIGSHCLYSQNMPDFSKDTKDGKGYVRCLNKDGSWVRIYKNPSAKGIEKFNINFCIWDTPL